jgi:peptide/nickel transport system permease protein
VGRFKRESLAGALIQHGSILEILDAGVVDGHHFIAMEFFDGRDLGKTLQEAYVWSAAETGLLLWVVVPGLYIVAIVLAFTLLGFALDEIVNPRLRRR